MHPHICCRVEFTALVRRHKKNSITREKKQEILCLRRGPYQDKGPRLQRSAFLLLLEVKKEGKFTTLAHSICSHLMALGKPGIFCTLLCNIEVRQKCITNPKRMQYSETSSASPSAEADPLDPALYKRKLHKSATTCGDSKALQKRKVASLCF